MNQTANSDSQSGSIDDSDSSSIHYSDLGRENERVALHLAYTGGTFDLFHKSHVRLLQWCKAITKELAVSLNTHEFIFEYKKKLPVIRYEERREVLLSCKYVDQVIPNIGGADSKMAITK